MQKKFWTLCLAVCMGLLFICTAGAAPEEGSGKLPVERIAVGNQNDYSSGGGYGDSDSSASYDSYDSWSTDDSDDSDFSAGSSSGAGGSGSWTSRSDDDDFYSSKNSSESSGSASSRKSASSGSTRNASSRKSSSDSSSSSSGGAGTVILIIFGAIFLIVLISVASNSVSVGRGGYSSPPKRRDNGVQRPQKPRPSSNSWQPVARPAANQLAELRRIDPDFSEPAFLAWAREVFIQLNTAWTKQDWAMIRPFESDALFREHSMQLDEYKRNGTVNYLERVAVKDSFIESYFRDEQYEYLVVKMRTSMIDYVMETATGRITAGDRTTLWQMMHTLTFMRRFGVKTHTAEERVYAENCPNCGAPVNVNTASVCEYCKSTLSSGNFDWVLCKFSGKNL